MDVVAPDRYRVVTWEDPLELQRRSAGLSGLEILHRIAGKQLSPPPLAELLGFAPTFVSPGLVAFGYEPREEHYNTHGTIHGGVLATLLDTAMGCAVQSVLDAGVGYATVELKTSFVKAVTLATGPLRAEGKVVHAGGRLATAEARLTDEAGRLYAHGSCTCLVLAGSKVEVPPLAA